MRSETKAPTASPTASPSIIPSFSFLHPGLSPWYEVSSSVEATPDPLGNNVSISQDIMLNQLGHRHILTLVRFSDGVSR
jgi:hypothetical protein